MYDTPSRTNSRTRRPPMMAAPSIPATTPSGTRGRDIPTMPAFPTPQLSYHGSLHSVAPQTPQQKLMLRKPMSMQTLSSVRSSLKLSGTPRAPTAAESYRGKIHVGVRVRAWPVATPGTPLTSGPWILRPETNNIEHETAGDFRFDKIYDGNATNDELYNASVEPLITKVVEGYNATVFAYGTTGSGKTYTMQGTSQDPGVIPRAAYRLFELLNQKHEQEPQELAPMVQLSYFEIYNERVYDLLSQDPSKKPTEVSLRDNVLPGSDGTAGLSVGVVGQRDVPARSAVELLKWVALGDQLRRTSSTQYNEHSSRSHAVVRVHIRLGDIQSILYLCDLAGSERATEQSERRKEGSYINKSLLTLSTVISFLSQGAGVHVPYRDSKLTRLLQPSLSGTALVSMLCTIQTLPSAPGSSETLNSIRFAAKAKNITVVAKRNSVFEDTPAAGGIGGAASARLIHQLQLELEHARREVTKLRTERDDLQDRLYVFETASNSADAEASIELLSGISFQHDDDDVDDDAFGSKNSSVNRLQKDIERVRAENTQLKDENIKLEGRVQHFITEISELDAQITKLERGSHEQQATPLSDVTTAFSPSSSRPVSASSLHGHSQSTDSAEWNAKEAALLDEIAELKEFLVDKDRALEVLTGINRARERVDAWTVRSDSTVDAVEDLRI